MAPARGLFESFIHMMTLDTYVLYNVDALTMYEVEEGAEKFTYARI